MCKASCPHRWRYSRRPIAFYPACYLTPFSWSMVVFILLSHLVHSLVWPSAITRTRPSTVFVPVHSLVWPSAITRTRPSTVSVLVHSLVWPLAITRTRPSTVSVPGSQCCMALEDASMTTPFSCRQPTSAPTKTLLVTPLVSHTSQG